MTFWHWFVVAICAGLGYMFGHYRGYSAARKRYMKKKWSVGTVD